MTNPVQPIAWLREQRGEYEGPATLAPLLLLGHCEVTPHSKSHGATYEPLYGAAEIDALRRWKSTNAPRLEALQGLLCHAQHEAHEGREAAASLASERAANALLTNELDALRAELAREKASRQAAQIQLEATQERVNRSGAEKAREVMRLNEELARKSAPRWLPIESAPRDGTILLIGYKPCRRLEGSRRVYEGRWNVESDEWTSVNGFLIFAGATHWMPLPAAPDDAATGG